MLKIVSFLQSWGWHKPLAIWKVIPHSISFSWNLCGENCKASHYLKHKKQFSLKTYWWIELCAWIQNNIEIFVFWPPTSGNCSQQLYYCKQISHNFLRCEQEQSATTVIVWNSLKSRQIITIIVLSCDILFSSVGQYIIYT